MTDVSKSAQGSAPIKVSTLALTAPVAMGYIPLGSVFGFLFVQAGGDWWMAGLISLVVYAGAAQYMMVPMLAAGMSMGAIALAAGVVNLRHAFYGLSLLHRVPRGVARWYMAFGLTDETYSVLTTLPPGTPFRQMALLTMLNHLWWISGSVLGALVGAQTQTSLQGLDFVLAALFAVLTAEQWRTRQSAAPLWVAVAAFALSYPWAGDQTLLVSIVLCTVAALLWRPAPTGQKHRGGGGA